MTSQNTSGSAQKYKVGEDTAWRFHSEGDIKRDEDPMKDKPCCQRNRKMVVEYVFLFIQLTLGSIALNFSAKGPLSNRILGEILLTGGFIPIIATIAELAATGNSVLTLKHPRNGLSILMILLGLFLQWPKPDDGWLAAFATPILEGGVIYLIQRFLFIEEVTSEHIERLERENHKLRRSTARGLADSYFWNYALKVAEIIKEYKTRQAVVNYNTLQKEALHLKTYRFFMVIPAKFDLSRDPRTANQISDIVVGLKGRSIEGKLETSNMSQYFGRELYIRCMYREDDVVSGMYDVPTIVNTLVQNVYDLKHGHNAETGHKSDKDIEEIDLQESWEAELQVFIDRLATLIQQQGLQKFLKIIIVNNTVDDIDALYQQMVDAYEQKGKKDE